MSTYHTMSVYTCICCTPDKCENLEYISCCLWYNRCLCLRTGKQCLRCASIRGRDILFIQYFQGANSARNDFSDGTVVRCKQLCSYVSNLFCLLGLLFHLVSFDSKRQQPRVKKHRSSIGTCNATSLINQSQEAIVQFRHTYVWYSPLSSSISEPCAVGPLVKASDEPGGIPV